MNQNYGGNSYGMYFQVSGKIFKLQKVTVFRMHLHLHHHPIIRQLKI